MQGCRVPTGFCPLVWKAYVHLTARNYKPQTLQLEFKLDSYLSYSLNSVKGGYIRDYTGGYYRGY